MATISHLQVAKATSLQGPIKIIVSLVVSTKLCEEGKYAPPCRKGWKKTKNVPMETNHHKTEEFSFFK